jgi:hypothetical protein
MFQKNSSRFVHVRGTNHLLPGGKESHR